MLRDGAGQHIFAPTRKLSICNAGHPRPLIYRAAEKKWSILEHTEAEDRRPSNIPLGILDLAEYEQFEVQLNVGDLVIFYTDALTEARTKDGELLGEAGLLEIVEGLDRRDPEKFIDGLLEQVGARHVGNLSSDDVTILLLCPNGRRPNYSFGEKLWAQARLMGKLIRAIDPRGAPAAAGPEPGKYWRSNHSAVGEAIERGGKMLNDEF